MAEKKYVHEINLIGDTQASGTAELYWSDDDYVTWQGPKTFDLTAKVKNVTRLGAHFDGRAYKLNHSSNAAFRAEALEIRYAIGTP